MPCPGTEAEHEDAVAACDPPLKPGLAGMNKRRVFLNSHASKFGIKGKKILLEKKAGEEEAEEESQGET